jgi:LPXTG-site transpeptidase (sortase) family protein
MAKLKTFNKFSAAAIVTLTIVAVGCSSAPVASPKVVGVTPTTSTRTKSETATTVKIDTVAVATTPTTKTAGNETPVSTQAKVQVSTTLATVVKADSLSISKIGLDVPFYDTDGTLDAMTVATDRSLASANFGKVDNAVLTGHRTSKSKPFSRLNELGVGDTLTTSFGGVSEAWKVTSTQVVTEEAANDFTEPATKNGAKTLTLITCAKDGSGAPGGTGFRIVVIATRQH